MRPLGFLLVFTIVAMTNAQSAVLEYRLLEEQPGGALVGNLLHDAMLNRRYSSPELAQMYFRFLTPTTMSDYFVVRNSSGELRTTRRVDRETICADDAECDAIINLDIAVQPKDYFQVINVKVRIDDVNDNAPVFPSNHHVVTISESATVGSLVALPSARDPDAGSYGVRTYMLQTSVDEFELRVAPDVSDCHLVLKKPLDRETTRSYLLHLVAVDGGIPERSAVAAIQVQVIDANDNTPQFDTAVYGVEIDESAEIGSVLVIVHARDPDDGVNGRIAYRFTSESAQMYGDVFGLNATTGEVFLRRKVDYEERAVYHLSVMAEDSGHEPLVTFARVTIRVRDVNDHTPRVIVNALTSSGLVELREGEPEGTFVAHVSVTDPDGGDGGRVTCVLDDQRYFALRRLYATAFKVVSTASLDRETQSVHTIKILCRDGGQPPRTAEETLVVMVTDVNDHCPIFSDERYHASIVENAPSGSYVALVNATDADVDENGAITYRVASDDVPVSVDPLSGIVTTSRILDHEATAQYELIIVATDHGPSPCSSTATLTLDVVDINDEVPRFRFTSYKFATYENQQVGIEVGKVDALDADSAPFNIVTYSLDWPGSETFAIDANTGVITSLKQLNREEREVYTLIVVADNGPGSLANRANVTIHVADRNDNSPVVLFPTEIDNAIEVSALAEVGDVVGSIVASDTDSGDNARLFYNVVGGSGRSVFTVNENTGDITPRKSLQTDADQLYRLNIVVRDRGSPALQTVTYLNVFVNSSLVAASGHRGFNALAGSGAVLIVVVVATLAVCFALFVLAVIIAWRRHRRHKRNAAHKYNCRVEAAERAVMETDDICIDKIKQGSWKEEMTKCCAHKNRLHFSTPPSGHCQCKKDTKGNLQSIDMSITDNLNTHRAANLLTSPMTKDQSRPATIGAGSSASVPPPRDCNTNYMDEARRRLLYSSPQKSFAAPPSYQQYQLQRSQRALESDSDLDSQTDSGRGLSEEGEAGQVSPLGSTEMPAPPPKWKKYSNVPPRKSCLKPLPPSPPEIVESRYDESSQHTSHPAQWRHQSSCKSPARLRFADSPDCKLDDSRFEIEDCVHDVVGEYLRKAAAAAGVRDVRDIDTDSDDETSTSGSYVVDGADDCVVAIQRDIFV